MTAVNEAISARGYNWKRGFYVLFTGKNTVFILSLIILTKARIRNQEFKALLI